MIKEKAKKPENGSLPGQLSGKISHTWLELLNSIPAFSGNTNDVKELLVHRAAFYRAKAILAEFDQFTFPGRQSPKLIRMVQLLRKRTTEFPERYHLSLVALMDTLKSDLAIFHATTDPQNIVNMAPADCKMPATDPGELAERMHLLVPLVREAGYVPAEELDHIESSVYRLLPFNDNDNLNNH